MITCSMKKEGLLSRNFLVQTATLPEGVLLDRLNLVNVPNNASRIYIEVPAGHTLVHTGSAFGSFYVVPVVNGTYKTDVKSVQVSPIYMAPEKTGLESLRCGCGFDVEVLCPDYYSMPLPVRIAVFLDYTPMLVTHEKLTEALHDRVPVDIKTLQEILQTAVRASFAKWLTPVLSNQRLTVEQINGVVVGEEGERVRLNILRDIENLAILYGLNIECGNFYQGEIFDRPGSSVWKDYCDFLKKKISQETIINSSIDDGRLIQITNAIKIQVEESDYELNKRRESMK